MTYVKTVFRRHLGYITGYPLSFIFLLAVYITILIYSYNTGSLLAAVGYLLATWLGAVVVDSVVALKPLHEPVFIIKRPAKTELLVISACTLLGAGFLCIRFFSDWDHMQGLLKLAFMPLIIFTFPIALAAIYLFVFKYKFKELGINFNYWYLPLFLHLIWGVITLSVAPEKSHWQSALEEYGILSFLFTGIFTAALSEEFSRMLIQTRITAISNNKFMGIFIASVIWSALHIPVGYSQDPAGFTVWTAIISVIYLVPLGVFWGYLTQRTQSIIPVILMHGFNLWGLQNF